jgi:hypothetical protein
MYKALGFGVNPRATKKEEKKHRNVEIHVMKLFINICFEMLYSYSLSYMYFICSWVVTDKEKWSEECWDSVLL